MKCRSGLVATTVLFFLLFPPWSHGQSHEGGIIIRLDTTYYKVRGGSVEELRSQVKALGPLKGGKRYDAGTEYQIRWRYRNATTGGLCRFDSVEVYLNVTFVYPQWDVPPSASDRLIETWRRYYTRLLEHEDGHFDLALAGCKEILQSIKGIQPAITCRAIEEKAESIAEEIAADVKKKQADYDRITDHGAAQGVRLDP